MKKPLKLLIVEDNPDDAEFLLAELLRVGFDPQWKRVDTEPDFLAELNSCPDIILADSSMPRFTGLRAAELLRASGLDIPFILVSGTVGEDVAVAAMKLGATDYLLKDRLARLGSAVEHALAGKRLRVQRQQAETALQEEQAMSNGLVATIPDLIYFKDLQSRFIRINEAMVRRLGLRQAEEAVGKTDFDFHGQEHARQAYEDEQHVMQTGEHLVGREEKETWPEGQLTWVSTTKLPLRNPQGNITGLVGISRDITAAKKSEARFRRLLDSNAQSVIFWNTQGEITGGNDAFLKLVGHAREDLDAGCINWVTMTPPEYADLDQHALKELATTGTCATYEKEWIRKDGARVPILLGAAMFEDSPNEGVCFVLDLTERKKIEAQLRQSQKMESIGTLAGGVAHDFNNILAVIQMQSEMLTEWGDLSPSQAELIEGIGAAIHRANALTRQLLVFSRKEKMQLGDLDLNQSINSITNMLRRILGEDIQTQFKFALQPLFIHADAGMVDQVLMNLAVNSRDAMPKGGRLVIEISAVDFDETVSAQSAQGRPGSFVCLSVSDNGCGIAPENLSRVFEPFFTTKGVGKGTGLGLATVFGIVQQHKGWVNVYSEVGQGTTFRIYLPRLAKLSISPQKTEQPVLTTVRGGDETILLVEDDNFLRSSVRQTLTHLGYRVLEASNGIEALKVWQQHRAEIHLLLTDMVMPGGLTGKDLSEQLLQENPKLKVIYASGYSAEIVSLGFALKEGVNFLTKPFQARKLAQTIRQSLDMQTPGT
ncbi:MAG: sensor hybrid histidine kinase [Pedosphaera sp.]|nr:sensor hybrid histidine kinase [Pedosphaera sp.]